MTSVTSDPSSLPVHPVKDVKAAEPDAHGQAALMLTESLIHTLVDKAVLTTAEAVDLVTIAAEVKVEVAEAAGESEARMRDSLVLLARIAVSFEADRDSGRQSRSASFIDSTAKFSADAMRRKEYQVAGRS